MIVTREPSHIQDLFTCGKIVFNLTFMDISYILMQNHLEDHTHKMPPNKQILIWNVFIIVLGFFHCVYSIILILIIYLFLGTFCCMCPIFHIKYKKNA